MSDFNSGTLIRIRKFPAIGELRLLVWGFLGFIKLKQYPLAEQTVDIYDWMPMSKVTHTLHYSNTIARPKGVVLYYHTVYYKQCLIVIYHCYNGKKYIATTGGTDHLFEFLKSKLG